MKDVSLYIHIPFCMKKCRYCDFNSYSQLDHLHEEYVDCVINEMKIYQMKLGDVKINTVYIGGGTPTCLSQNLIQKLMEACFNTFNVVDESEISIESNPGTLTREKLKSMRSSGINRLSIGLQSWNDEELKRLGRIHTRQHFVENYYTARQQGFDNINIDLMFSLPEQTLGKWENTLEHVIQLCPEHLSCYSLKIEENTEFFAEYEEGMLNIPDEETDRMMYQSAIEKLAQHHYRQYEISNFSKIGFECRHNLVYWKCGEYIGLGAGAHSYLNSERYSNISSPTRYMAQIQKGCLPIDERFSLNQNDRMIEFVILGLRLKEGISEQEFYDRFHKEITQVFPGQLKKWVRLGLIDYSGDRYRLTMRGMDVSNQVFMEFI